MTIVGNPFMNNPFMNLPSPEDERIALRQKFQIELSIARDKFRNVNIGDTITIWWENSDSEFSGVVYKLDLQTGNIIMRDGRVWMQTLINKVRQVLVIESSFLPKAPNPFMI